jgi:hypothetical protein
MEYIYTFDHDNKAYHLENLIKYKKSISRKNFDELTREFDLTEEEIEVAKMRYDIKD